jgi:acyl-CoA synthetase (AMP-forming)/AMP-acid ligase II
MVAVLAVSGDLSGDEAKAYLRETAASFKTPGHVLVRPPEWVPRTASGKVAKQLLKAKVVGELAVAGE